jgi:hypothetical protein
MNLESEIKIQTLEIMNLKETEKLVKTQVRCIKCLILVSPLISKETIDFLIAYQK